MRGSSLPTTVTTVIRLLPIYFQKIVVVNMFYSSNEKQNAGSYVVDFNSSEYNLPSGIYFYTLNAGEFKETRKMVLIK